MREQGLIWLVMLAISIPAIAGGVSKGAIVEALVRDGQLSLACVREDARKETLVGVQEQDLNQDGVPEYLVEGMRDCACGAQKCDFWVYAQEGGTLRLLMQATGDELELGPERTIGYTDLIVTYLYRGKVKQTTLRFDGSSYTDIRRIRR